MNRIACPFGCSSAPLRVPFVADEVFYCRDCQATWAYAQKATTSSTTGTAAPPPPRVGFEFRASYGRVRVGGVAPRPASADPRVEKLRRLRDHPSTGDGERAAAQAALDRLGVGA